jgi:uncharacterized membrane protein
MHESGTMRLVKHTCDRNQLVKPSAEIASSVAEEKEGKSMLRDRDPKHWKFLVFYYNPDTSRLFVAKRYGTPLTLNFARPMAWVIAVLPFAIAIAATTLNHLHRLR